MIRKSKKFLVTTQSREVFILRQTHHKTVNQFCDECQLDVEMLTIDASTTISGHSTRKLFEMITNRQIHSIEIPSGHLLICQKSLEKTTNKTTKLIIERRN